MDAEEPKRRDPYTNCCYLCGTEMCLKMHPIRNMDGEMVGWIFVCSRHEDAEIPETVSL